MVGGGGGMSGGTFPQAIFVGGHQRSGTTLMAKLLAEHPEITGLVRTGASNDEGQFVQDVYLNEFQMSYPSLQTMRWGYHPHAHLTESEAGVSTAAARLIEAWHSYFEKPHAKFFVEKTPSNISRVRFLNSAFPEAHFVIMTRNPVTQGLAVRKWANKPLRVGLGFREFIEHWLFVMERFADDRRYLDNVVICAYEDLVTSPAAVLESIQASVGVESVPSPGITAVHLDTVYEDYWLRVIGQKRGRFTPLNARNRPASAVPRALERVIVPTIGRAEAHRMIRDLEPRVNRFGYSLLDVSSAQTWR